MQIPILLLELVQLPVRVLFDVNEVITGSLEGFDQLVELEMHRPGVAVLGVLDQEDHQKRGDGCGGVDHELPGIGKMEEGPGNRPDYDERQGEHESQRAADYIGDPQGDFVEQVFHLRDLS